MKKYNVVITSVDRTAHGWAAKAKMPNSPLDVGWEKDYYKDPPKNYIIDTVISMMENAGFDIPTKDFLEISIFDSGSKSLDYLNPIKVRYPQINIVPSPIPHDGIDLDPSITLVHNSNRALVEGAKDSRFVIFIQDDVVFAHNAFFEMDEWISGAPEGFGFLTFWPHGIGGRSAKRNKRAKPAHKPGYSSIAPNGFWGSLCLVFNSSDIEDLCGDPEMHRGRTTGHDMAIKAWAHRTKRKVYGHNPPLVDHVGHQSTVASRHKRTNSAFIGETTDAYNRKVILENYVGDAGHLNKWEILNKYYGNSYNKIAIQFILDNGVDDILCISSDTNTIFNTYNKHGRHIDTKDGIELEAPKKDYQCIICHEFYPFSVQANGFEKTDEYISSLLKKCKYLIFDTGGPTEQIGKYRIAWSSILKSRFKDEEELLKHFDCEYTILDTYPSKHFPRTVIAIKGELL